MARTYWIDLFIMETWQEFLSHGGDVSGFSEKRRPSSGSSPVTTCCAI
jgi:hypothetical protein